MRQLYAALKNAAFRKRTVAYLVMATLLFSLGYLAGSSKQAAPWVKLHNGYRFDGMQQRAAEAAFARASLQSHQWVGEQLRVPKNQQHIYTAVLAGSGVVGHITPMWQNNNGNARQQSKVLTATEKTCVEAIKWLPGIANASVISHIRPTWEKNVWARNQAISVSVSVEAMGNTPIPRETIITIGNIVAPAFGITNRKDIGIVDVKHRRSYDGVGEAVGEPVQQLPEEKYARFFRPGQIAQFSSPLVRLSIR